VSARIDADPTSANANPTGAAAAPPVPLALPVALDPDVEIGNDLPSDHPAWTKDALSLSQRARALLTKLRPVVIRVLSFWDHRVRSILVGGRTLSVDASGSYRLE
jgi:hypothetical protein